MEAVPRLPMISFELNVTTENASFGPKLKQYITSFYHEDGESYTTEIHNLETLRAAAVRPTIDVSGCQILKKYYCQLHFLKSRFPMEEGQPSAVNFSWKNTYSTMACNVPEIQFELMCILYNIGALHSKLGAAESRVSHEGMKIACTHFQCAAWAFQTVKETYPQMVNLILAHEICHFMQQVCLAQAQECILEKSMLDNRKATIIAKVAVQVVDYYKHSLQTLQAGGEEGSFSDLVGSRFYKEWVKYLSFKVAYHKCIALLFQGQQAEEQQKMGERVAFYQAACEQLDEARKLASNLTHQQEIGEALAFTSDVVEGKRKAAKNENEFIYHEDVPERDALQEVKGASLVKGISFSFNDVEVSGNDIFARLVPMEAHEAASLYSERKAQMLRQLGELVEGKDQKLAEFMSSLQLDVLTQMRQATGLSQDIVDRAAALSAKPTATQDLVDAMAKLSDSYHEVEAMLNEIQELLKEEEQNEKEYQAVMGKRPPSIIATDLAREASKYKEAHSKASESNQTLHRAMTTHVANLKILMQPLSQLQHQIPYVELPNKNVDEGVLRELEGLLMKIEEMKNQRAMLWAQLREAIHKDDITSVIVTRQPGQAMEDIFQQELQKHQQLSSLIQQNTIAQDNILKSLVDIYAQFTNSRRYLQDVINKRNTTITALITSYDTYDDLLAKANKGIDFYGKLETNVSKLLQRIKSACKVQEEERDQMLARSNTVKPSEPVPVVSNAPKLKDYLDSMKKDANVELKNMPYSTQVYPSGAVNVARDQNWTPGIRPAPLGSEMTNDIVLPAGNEQVHYGNYGSSAFMNLGSTMPTQAHAETNMSYSQNAGTNSSYAYNQRINNAYGYDVQPTISSASDQQQVGHNINAVSGYSYTQNPIDEKATEQVLADRMAALMTNSKNEAYSNQYAQYGYNPQTAPTYSATNYSYPTITQSYTITPSSQQVAGSFQATDYNRMSYPNTTPVGQLNIQTHYSVAPTLSQDTTGTNTYLQYSAAASDNSSFPYAYSGVPLPTTNANSYTSYIPQGYGSPSVPVTGVNSMSYSTNTYNQQAQNYSYQIPSENDPSYSQDNTSNNYGNTYGSSEQNASVSIPQQYGYNTYDSNYMQASNDVPQNPVYTQAYPNNSYTYTQTSAQPYYNNYANNMSNAAASTNIPPQSTPASLPTVPAANTQPTNSNVDLLAGLDFSINQVPLVPQPSSTSSKGEKEIPVAKIESQSNVPLKTKSLEQPNKPAGVKTSEIKLLEIPKKNLLANPDTFQLFLVEVEKYEKFVDSLTIKTLNGPTTLDVKWKEIQDKQDVEVQKRSISVARCYPMKNRSADILPYDSTRVELGSTNDDYINASHIRDITPYTPPFIVTQAPMQATVFDFWTMVREQQVEIIVCLLSDNELGDDIYWPRERGQDLHVSEMVISLQNIFVKPHWTERVITITLPEQRESKVVLHLQFTAWSGSLFPTTPAPFVNFIKEIISQQQQQRVPVHPVLIHCLSGVGRSGLVCLLIPAILDLRINPTSIPDLAALAVKLSAARKNILRDREHLKFAYQAFLEHLKHLQSNEIGKKIPAVQTTEESLPTAAGESHSDPLSCLDPFWATKKEN